MSDFVTPGKRIRPLGKTIGFFSAVGSPTTIVAGDNAHFMHSECVTVCFSRRLRGSLKNLSDFMLLFSQSGVFFLARLYFYRISFMISILLTVYEAFFDSENSRNFQASLYV